MNCLKCGAKLEKDAVFCTSCGAKVETPKNVCQKCGAVYRDDALFCEKCGAKVGVGPDLQENSPEDKAMPKQEQGYVQEVKQNVAPFPAPVENNTHTLARQQHRNMSKKTKNGIIAIVVVLCIVAFVAPKIYINFLCKKGITCYKEAKYSEALPCLQKAADKGNPEAMYLLGMMCWEGAGVLVDNTLAVAWFKKAAELGNTDAMKSLGDIYYAGGAQHDVNEAVKWYTKSAESGNAIAMYTLYCTRDKLSSRDLSSRDSNWKDWQEMVDIIIEDKRESPKFAEVGIGWLKKSLPLLQNAAETGNTEAMVYLADIYYSGFGGVERDYKEAVKWYKKAAEAGNIKAMRLFAAESWRLNKEDIKEPEKWRSKVFLEYKRLAEAGNAKAMCELGECYDHGWGKKDRNEAYMWFKRSAEANYAEAMYYLSKGEDEIGKDEAIKWLNRSAEEGYPDAMCTLGVFYDPTSGYNPFGVNVTEAIKWYKKAIEAGVNYLDPISDLLPRCGEDVCMESLGLLYELTGNVSEAIKWYKRTGDLDHLRELGVNIPPTEYLTQVVNERLKK